MNTTKKLIILCLGLLLGWSTNAQNNSESRQKIKTLKIAFLTEQLSLTTKEAEKFWPIYNSHEKIIHELRLATRKNLIKIKEEHKDPNTISEKEAKRIVSFKMETDQKIHEEQLKFISKLKDILSY
ncbi:MAG: hypothetical protein ABF265_01485, partial [Polaribacter sp.]